MALNKNIKQKIADKTAEDQAVQESSAYLKELMKVNS